MTVRGGFSHQEQVDVQRAMRQAAAAVERDLETLSLELTDVVFAAVTDFERIVDHAELRAALIDAVRIVVSTVTTGEAPEAQPTSPHAVAIAQALARAGEDMQVLVRGINLSHGAFLQPWELALASQDLPADTLLAATRLSHRLTFALVDHWGQELATAYQEEHDRQLRSGEARRMRGIRALLAGEPHDAAALSRLLRYDLNRTHTALVVWQDEAGGDETLRLGAAADVVAQRLGAPSALTMPAGISTVWAWVATDGPQPLPPLVDVARSYRALLAVGEPAAGTSGFRTSHRDALDAARVVRTGRRRQTPTSVAYGQVQLAATFSADLDRARRFVQAQLGDLGADDDEMARLRATLRVYLEEQGSRAATSERLGIHPNTVGNRIRSCEHLLERDTGSSRVELEVALKLADQLGKAVLG